MRWSFVLTGALTALSANPAVAQQATGEEKLLGAEVKPAGITFHVPTGGCTKKANFGLETWSFQPLTVRLVRLRPDYCQSVQPQGTQITFSFSEMGAGHPPRDLRDVVIVNAKAP